MILPISTIVDYLCLTLNIDNESNEMDNFMNDEKNNEQIILIGEILAIEHSIYLLRRSNQVCGSHIDSIASLRSKLINLYEPKYGTWLKDNVEEMY